LQLHQKGQRWTLRSIHGLAEPPYVIIVDSDSQEFEALNNLENVNRLKGAGIHAATMISE